MYSSGVEVSCIMIDIALSQVNEEMEPWFHSLPFSVFPLIHSFQTLFNHLHTTVNTRWMQCVRIFFRPNGTLKRIVL